MNDKGKKQVPKFMTECCLLNPKCKLDERGVYKYLLKSLRFCLLFMFLTEQQFQ